MSESPYSDRPKYQNEGIHHLCMCLDGQRQPTYGSDAVGDTMYWCVECGLHLGFREMDAYCQSDVFAMEKASRKQKARGD